MQRMTPETREDARRRLARIAGQVAGLQKMVESERYCVDVITQVAALRAALDQFGLLMVSSHVEDCIYGAGEDDNHKHEFHDKNARVAELRTTLNRFLK
jgi:DNA-binding FrmR family transcriptional regulator